MLVTVGVPVGVRLAINPGGKVWDALGDGSSVSVWLGSGVCDGKGVKVAVAVMVGVGG